MASQGTGNKNSKTRASMADHVDSSMAAASKTANFNGHGFANGSHPTGSPHPQQDLTPAQKSKAHRAAPMNSDSAQGGTQVNPTAK